MNNAFKVISYSILSALISANMAFAQNAPASKAPEEKAGIAAEKSASKNDKTEKNKKAEAPEKKGTKYSFEERVRVENFSYPLFDKKRTGKKNYVQSRFRLKAEETFSEESKLTLTFQDCRYFERAPESDASISKNDFILYNAFLEVRNFAGIKGLFAKLGRQEVTFGNLRLFGNSNWGEGLVWDGARLIYKAKSGSFNLINFESRRNDLMPPVQIRGLYYVCDRVKGMEVYALEYVDRNRVAGEIAKTVRKNIDINTFGVNYTKKFNKKVEANVETAFQSGDWGPEKHRASAFHAEAKYNTLNKSNYSIIVEYNEAAGDKNPLDGEHGTFCNLFPANHGKYGYMDYISWQNMKEIALRNELDIRKDLKAKLNYHRFRLQNAKDAWYRSNKSVFDSRRDAAGLSGTDIGSEIDLVLTKKLKANLEIEAGISKFKAGDFVKNTAKAGAETTDPSWGYIQVLKRW
ncbi:MAG TPA: alginate export family protein [Candidatus Wallbacteria bacterium]|nr:alginate export family protein [Candidatus Wallbacteria bacterium]